MSERALTFGPGGELVGVLSTPDSGADPDRPAVLMWNVGVNHRVGPFRAQVELAHLLAADGFTTFRFDASGLGDSGVRRQAIQEADREPLDIADAMDLVTTRTSIQRFVVVGYCSSVDAAHRMALDDDRVVGGVHIEGYAYRTGGFRRRSRRYMFDRVRWDRAIRRRVARALVRRSSPEGGRMDEPVYTRNMPTNEQFSADLARLTSELEKPHLFVYGSDSDVNHADQFWEMFDHPDLDRSRIAVRHIQGADHTFYDVRHRDEMLRSVQRWLSVTFPVQVDA